MRFQVFLSLWSVTSWLLTVQMLSFVCRVCERGRERHGHITAQCRVMRWVCVCVREWVSEWVRERETHITVESAVLTAACVLQTTHKSFISVSVTRLCSTFGLELIVKLRTFLNCLYIYFESWSLQLWKAYLTRGVRPITMHCQLAYQRRKRSVWERRGVEDLQ